MSKSVKVYQIISQESIISQKYGKNLPGTWSLPIPMRYATIHCLLSFYLDSCFTIQFGMAFSAASIALSMS